MTSTCTIAHFDFKKRVAYDPEARAIAYGVGA